jgi:hypothetical protein
MKSTALSRVFAAAFAVVVTLTLFDWIARMGESTETLASAAPVHVASVDR